jgi:pimeloyl-ACP methyl ester carboxylesterase
MSPSKAFDVPGAAMSSIDLNGARVAYAEAGSGETVLLLHSSASSSAQWRALTEILQVRWGVLAPDLYGYGKTDQRLCVGSPGLADEVALADAVLAQSAERIHLVGHSYGGAVALCFAAHRPERLLSLTLIEPVAFHLLCGAPEGTAEHGLFREVAALAADVTQSAAEKDGRRGMARFIDATGRSVRAGTAGAKGRARLSRGYDGSDATQGLAGDRRADTDPARQHVAAAHSAHRRAHRPSPAGCAPQDDRRGGAHAPAHPSRGRQRGHRRAPVLQSGRPATPGGRLILPATRGDLRT